MAKKARKTDEYGNVEPTKIVGSARVIKHTTQNLVHQVGRMVTGEYQKGVREDRADRKAAAERERRKGK